MFRSIFIVFSFVIAASVNAASLSNLVQQEQWQEVGVLDGQNGHHQRTSIELSQLKALSQDQVASYKLGYSEGLTQFCSVDTAYQAGNSGQSYRGECVNFSNEDELVLSWQAGLYDYEQMEEVMGMFSD
ncbi:MULTISPECIES: DUF2799 domain-containing protein [unclassified Agarivorans]|uniref:DUF2799 domain-containing protein n=1 Tax=unclassified Agarivorans TaxID=2636026 RepID=UPI003D7EDF09